MLGYQMNRTLFFIYLLLVLASPLSAEVKLDIDLPSEFSESDAISGTVIISHQSQDKIDSKSFTIDNKPLAVELQKEEPMTTGDLVLSFYRFSQAPQAKGFYLLPRIKVKVNGKEYQSIPRTYTVKQSGPLAPRAATRSQPPGTARSTTPLGGAQLPQPSTAAPTSNTPSATPPPPPQDQQFLKLEAFVRGAHELYPSQQTAVGYRYFYNVNVETTQETLPLLEAEGFIKIGNKTIKQEEADGVNAQQVEQVIEADHPGDYTFGPSFIEGRPYTLDPFGQRSYGSVLLSSTVPEVKLQVLPFPEQGKPPSFKGALGNFAWKVALASPSTVHVGDEIRLNIEATGSGNLNSVNIPDLCCQPGMSGLFNLSDLPPVGQISGDTKKFELKLRPLSTSMTEIPALEFSSFDPNTLAYVTSHTDPIPLTVLPSKQNDQPSQKLEKPQAQILQTPPAEKSVEETITAPPLQAEAEAADIEIESLYPLKASDLDNLTFGNWWSLILIPFGMAGILFQLNLSKYLEEVKKNPKVHSSLEIFSNAEAALPNTTERYFLISQALLVRLVEKGLIPSADTIPEALSTEGLPGKVRSFLLDMQEKRYTGKKLQEDVLLMEAKTLLEELDSSGVHS